MEQYKAHLIGIQKEQSTFTKITKDAGNILKSFGATLGSMAANWAIGEVISYVAEIIYKTSHAEEIAAEKAKELQEKADEAASNIKSTNETLNSHKKTIEEVGTRYAELAQEVDKLGNARQNQGTLTNDEYNEFLDISNQLSDIFPSLTKGYDDNGNAILGLNGDVNTITTSLQNLLDKEKELANQEINKNLVDVFAGINSDIKGYEHNIDDINNQIEDIKAVMEGKNSNNLLGNSIYLGYSNQATYLDPKIYNSKYEEKLKSYTKLLDEYDVKYEQLSKEMEFYPYGDLIDTFIAAAVGQKHFSEYLHILSDPDEVQEAFTRKLADLNNELKVQQDLIDSSNNSIKSYISQWAKTDYGVLKLNPTDQNALISLLDNIDWIQMPDEWEEAKAKIYKDYISVFKNASDEVQEAFTHFFSGENLTVEDYKKYKDQIQQHYKDLGLEVPAELKLTFHSELSGRNVKQMDEDVKKLFNKDFIDEFENNYEQLSLSDLVIASDQLDIPDGTLTSWDELLAKIKEFKKNAKDTEPLSFTDAISQVQTLSKGLEQLDKIYADVYDKEDFDWASMLNNDEFKNIFVGFSKEYDEFIKTVSNSPDDINACQSAFDNLVTAYINSSDAMKNLSEETKTAAIEMLKQMGISNAHEIVTARLAAQEAFLAENKENSAIASDNLAQLALSNLKKDYFYEQSNDCYLFIY